MEEEETEMSRKKVDEHPCDESASELHGENVASVAEFNKEIEDIISEYT